MNEPVSELYEQLVASEMTEGVVDDLEVIDVHHQHRNVGA